jgi:hypothetical protein
VSESYGFNVPYDNFLPEVLPYVPDCPEFVAINAIRNACIEFCEKTHYVQVDLDPITGVANVPNYQIDTPTDTAFCDVIQAWYNNVLLIPKNVDELTRMYRSVDWRTLSGNPGFITRVIQPELLLVPFPILTAPNALTIRAALAPTRASTTVQSRVWEHYVETIALGARARLYNTPGQPYYNPKAAAEMRMMFRVAMMDARRKTEKSITRADTRIQFTGWV